VAEAEAPVVAAVRAAVAEAAKEAGVAEAAVAVAVQVQAEAVDLVEVVEVVEVAAVAGARVAERRHLPNQQARAPELLAKVIKPNRCVDPRLLLLGISNCSLIFSIHP
jgi:hypothetical protein